MNQTPDPLWTAYDRFSTWFKDRGKDLFLAVLQGLIGGGLFYAIVVSSWQAGSFPPKLPNGISDVIATSAILAWSVVALAAAIGILFRVKWGWMLQILVVAPALILMAYFLYRFDWRAIETPKDWWSAICAITLTGGLCTWIVEAYRKAFPKFDDNSEVHSASHESATTNTR